MVRDRSTCRSLVSLVVSLDHFCGLGVVLHMGLCCALGGLELRWSCGVRRLELVAALEVSVVGASEVTEGARRNCACWVRRKVLKRHVESWPKKYWGSSCGEAGVYCWYLFCKRRDGAGDRFER